jgi:hypothetical protein
VSLTFDGAFTVYVRSIERRPMRRTTATQLFCLGLAIAGVTWAQAASPFRYPAQRKPAAPATTTTGSVVRPVPAVEHLACLPSTAFTKLVIE